MASLAALAWPAQGPALAAGISLIRDAEIEQTLDEITNPILEAAGIEPGSVKLYIVRDRQLNAFVAGGMNLFLNTGLLMKTADPTELAGVIAHEVGHIAGGHLTRAGLAQKRAAAEMILGAVLGAAAAVAGAPAVGAALMTGGQTVAQGNFMSFSRSQEQAADQAAMSILDRLHVSADGLARFFGVLEDQNVLSVSGTTPYLRSHPLTRDRMQFVEAHAAASRSGARPPPAAWVEGHQRMVVKLTAFLDDPVQALQRFPDDGSLINRYGRAIALYRLPDLSAAVAEIDGLLAEHPDDPYFHELKGQMLFENGKVGDAIAPYREAVRLAPGSALLRIGLARALIEAGVEPNHREAIQQLEQALQVEPNNADAWRLEGIAKGQAGQEGPSSLALAEWALLVGKERDARLYARRAEANLDPKDPGWLRLQDILKVIEEG